MNLKRTFYFLAYVVISLFIFSNTLIANQNSDGPVARSARQNKTASLKAGLYNMTFKSKIDGSPQPLKLKVPEGYLSEQKWPLLVTLHGLGDGPTIVPEIDSMVQIGPYGRGDTSYEGIGEKDVFECIEFAKKLFSIDPNRIYLCGFSMGGQGTFKLGLQYPDMWAACVPVCGAIDHNNLYLIENGNNLPFWVNAGSIDEVVSAKFVKHIFDNATEFGYNHWKYTEHENMGHSFEIDWSNIEKWLLKQTRKTKPSHIIFNSDVPAKSYWLEIISKINEDEKARIEAEITEQKIIIKTNNISDYQIYFDSAPIVPSRDVTITENGETIFHGKIISGDIFKKSENNKVN